MHHPSANSSTSSKLHRVVFACHKLEGGIGRNILRLSRGLIESGIQVEVWLESEDLDFPDELPPGIKLRVLASTHALWGPLFFWRLISQFNPQIIITPSERFTRIAFQARKLTSRKPVIIARVHNFYSMLYGNLSSRKQQKRKRRFRQIYPRIEHIVCVSAGVKKDFLGYAGLEDKNISVIYNPVASSGQHSRADTQLPVALDLSLPTIVTVGRLVRQKNHSFLLESFFVLRRSVQCNLIIVGDGIEYEKLKQQAESSPYKDSVFLVGHQTDPYRFIEHAQLFALTSSFEGFGNVVVESLMCGTPVVSTSSGGPNEILSESYLGEVVDTDSPELFAKALKSWLEKPKDLQALKDFAQKNFSIDTVTRRYLQLFDRLLA